jgi:hypothetical protein
MTAVTTITTKGETSALCASVGVSRASFYRRQRPAAPPRPRAARAPSPRALRPDERQAVLDVLHSERFVDQSPAEVHATLLEEQTYLCSTRTMYRLLADAGEVRGGAIRPGTRHTRSRSSWPRDPIRSGRGTSRS